MLKLAARGLPLIAFLAACGGEPEPAPVTPAPPPPAPPPVAEAAPPPVVSAAPAAPPAPPPRPGGCPEGTAYIAGGEFVFGPTKEKHAVKGYCLDLNETTSEEYGACVKGGKCNANFVTSCDPSTYGKADQAKMPMVCVDFPQSAGYCAAQGKRLPSTEEWEWAARGGAEARLHPWGADDLGAQLCWSGKEKRKGPCAIGSFPAGDSPQGVHDLLGGTGEWTTSRVDATSATRIGRGASWKDGDKALFATNRQGAFKVSYRCGFLGIRCAMDAPKP